MLLSCFTRPTNGYYKNEVIPEVGGPQSLPRKVFMRGSGIFDALSLVVDVYVGQAPPDNRENTSFNNGVRRRSPITNFGDDPNFDKRQRRQTA